MRWRGHWDDMLGVMSYFKGMTKLRAVTISLWDRYKASAAGAYMELVTRNKATLQNVHLELSDADGQLLSALDTCFVANRMDIVQVQQITKANCH